MKPNTKQTNLTSTAIPLLRRSNHSVLSSSSRPQILSKPSKQVSEFSLRLLINQNHSSTPSISKYAFSESPLNALTQITSPKQLPKKLSNLSQFETSQEQEGLGTPATRKDVTDLKDWLNMMLIKALDSSSNPESLYDTANKIYKVCFQEIIRQVKVQCKERGELIKLVWDTYQGLFQHAIRITQTQQDCLAKEHQTEKQGIEKKHEKQVADLMKIIADLKKVNNQLEKDLKAKEQAYEHKFNHELRVLQVLDIFKQQYSLLKEDLLMAKEENRIMKIKYDNLQNITIKAANKFKRKSESFIKNAVKSDPLMQYTGDQPDTEVSKNLIEHSNFHTVKQEEDLFTRADFVDQETNTRVLSFVNSGVNTSVEDLCGESFGVKMRKKRRSKISITDNISITPKSDSLVEVTEELLERNEFLEAQMKRKHIFVKRLLQNISQNLNLEMTKEDLPHSSILKAVVTGINKALNIITASPLENLKDVLPSPEAEEEKAKKFLLNIIASEEEKMIYSEHEILASMMVRKIGMTPAFKLKHAMFKKMLLKLITMFYEEKAKDSSSKIEFGVYVFSSLMKKYMMKKAAQNRFKHLLSSCVKYKNINRVRMFGRFVGLYGAFDSTDLGIYFTNVFHLKSGLAGKLFQNLETAEQHFTQYSRCLECIKSVSKNFPVNEVNDLYHKLEVMKIIDKQTKTTLVDVDEFMEVVIEKHHSHKSNNYFFLKYIYEAADLNEDGYLQFREFCLLFRNLSSLPFAEASRLFDAFAENFLSENDVEVKAISLENFVEMNSTSNIFVPLNVFNFTQVQTDEEAEKKLEEVNEELEVKLNEIQWRLSESKELGEYQEEFTTLLETLRVKVYSYEKCSNPKSVWLCLRLLEEESKILLIQDRLNELLPKFAQGVI